MREITKHIAIPLILPAIFFVVVSLPVELLGCRNRGLIAALLAIAAGIFGIVAAVKGLIGKVRGDSNSFFWMASALILAIPAIFIVVIAI
jgi:hypothetical protein